MGDKVCRIETLESELARRNEELSEAQGEIAAQRATIDQLIREHDTLQGCVDSWDARDYLWRQSLKRDVQKSDLVREHNEVRAENERLTRERDGWKNLADSRGEAYRAARSRRDELQAKLDAAVIDVKDKEASRLHWAKMHDEVAAERDKVRDLATKRMRKWSEEAAKVRELQAKLDDPYSEVNQKAAAWDRVEAHPVIGPLSELPEGNSYAGRVGKRLDQLAEMESAVTELQPAEQRPTLDREAVIEAVYRKADEGMKLTTENIVDTVLALAPAVPEWLGNVPNKPEVKRLEDKGWLVNGTFYNLFSSAEGCRDEGYELLAIADAIEAEGAKRNDDDARAKAVYEALYPETDGWVPWDDAPKDRHDLCRRADRAGLVPPESEDK